MVGGRQAAAAGTRPRPAHAGRRGKAVMCHALLRTLSQSWIIQEEARMDTKLKWMICLSVLNFSVGLSQVTETITNGVSNFSNHASELTKASLNFLSDNVSPSYHDWNASKEEILVGLWMAKLYSRYHLSDHLIDKNRLMQPFEPGEFPECPPPSFCVKGVVFTNLYAKILPFTVHVSTSANDLKCVQVSFYENNKNETSFFYTVYCNLNTGTADLILSHQILPFQPPQSYLPLLPPAHVEKQKQFFKRENSLPKKAAPLSDNEIEVHSDL